MRSLLEARGELPEWAAAEAVRAALREERERLGAASGRARRAAGARRRAAASRLAKAQALAEPGLAGW